MVVKPDGGKGEAVRIETATVVWAAGVKANPLGKLIADAAGECELAGPVGRAGEPGLPVGNRPDVFVVGDLARLKGADGKPLPGVAPVAMQQGEYVARVIAGA